MQVSYSPTLATQPLLNKYQIFLCEPESSRRVFRIFWRFFLWISWRMPCKQMCRLRLCLVQCRNMRAWLQSTLTTLENSLALSYFTLEAPWVEFTPGDVQLKIRIISGLLDQTLRQMGCLMHLTDIGCNLCRQTRFWRMKLVVSHQEALDLIVSFCTFCIFVFRTYERKWKFKIPPNMYVPLTELKNFRQFSPY